MTRPTHKHEGKAVLPPDNRVSMVIALWVYLSLCFKAISPFYEAMDKVGKCFESDYTIFCILSPLDFPVTKAFQGWIGLVHCVDTKFMVIKNMDILQIMSK